MTPGDPRLSELNAALLFVPEEMREGIVKTVRSYVRLTDEAQWPEKRTVVIVKGKPCSKPPGNPAAAAQARYVSQAVAVLGVESVNRVAKVLHRPPVETNPYQGWARLQYALRLDKVGASG